MQTCTRLGFKSEILLVQIYTRCLFVQYKMSLKLRSLWVHGCLSFIHRRVHHIVLLNLHLHSYSKSMVNSHTSSASAHVGGLVLVDKAKF